MTAARRVIRRAVALSCRKARAVYVAVAPGGGWSATLVPMAGWRLLAIVAGREVVRMHCMPSAAMVRA